MNMNRNLKENEKNEDVRLNSRAQTKLRSEAGSRENIYKGNDQKQQQQQSMTATGKDAAAKQTGEQPTSPVKSSSGKDQAAVADHDANKNWNIKNLNNETGGDDKLPVQNEQDISKDTKETKNLSVQQSISPTIESPPNINMMPKLQMKGDRVEVVDTTDQIITAEMNLQQLEDNNLNKTQGSMYEDHHDNDEPILKVRKIKKLKVPEWTQRLSNPRHKPICVHRRNTFRMSLPSSYDAQAQKANYNGNSIKSIIMYATQMRSNAEQLTNTMAVWPHMVGNPIYDSVNEHSSPSRSRSKTKSTKRSQHSPLADVPAIRVVNQVVGAGTTTTKRAARGGVDLRTQTFFSQQSAKYHLANAKKSIGMGVSLSSDKQNLIESEAYGWDRPQPLYSENQQLHLPSFYPNQTQQNLVSHLGYQLNDQNTFQPSHPVSTSSTLKLPFPNNPTATTTHLLGSPTDDTSSPTGPLLHPVSQGSRYHYHQQQQPPGTAGCYKFGRNKLSWASAGRYNAGGRSRETIKQLQMWQQQSDMYESLMQNDERGRPHNFKHQGGAYNLNQTEEIVEEQKMAMIDQFERGNSRRGQKKFSSGAANVNSHLSSRGKEKLSIFTHSTGQQFQMINGQHSSKSAVNSFQEFEQMEQQQHGRAGRGIGHHMSPIKYTRGKKPPFLSPTHMVNTSHNQCLPTSNKKASPGFFALKSSTNSLYAKNSLPSTRLPAGNFLHHGSRNYPMKDGTQATNEVLDSFLQTSKVSSAPKRSHLSNSYMSEMSQEQKSLLMRLLDKEMSKESSAQEEALLADSTMLPKRRTAQAKRRIKALQNTRKEMRKKEKSREKMKGGGMNDTADSMIIDSSKIEVGDLNYQQMQQSQQKQLQAQFSQPQLQNEQGGVSPKSAAASPAEFEQVKLNYNQQQNQDVVSQKILSTGRKSDDEEEEDEEKAPEEPPKPQQLSKLISQMGQTKKIQDFREILQNGINEMISNREMIQDFNEEMEDIKNRMRSEKKREFEERFKGRSNQFMTKMAPHCDDHFQNMNRRLTITQMKTEKAQQRREQQDYEKLKYNMVFAIRSALVANVRQAKMQQAIELGMQRRNNVKMIKIIKLAIVIQTLNKNYKTMQEIYQMKMNAKIASIKIYLYLLRLIKQRGGMESIAQNDIRYRSTIQIGNTCVQKAFEYRASEMIRVFLYNKMKVNQLRLKIFLYINRISNIQKMYRRTVQVEANNRDSLIELMTQVQNHVSQLLLQNKKTLQVKYPKMLNELSKLDYASKEQAAQEHLFISKCKHTIELMRWYGRYQKSGKYDKDAIENIYAKLNIIYRRQMEWKKPLKRAFPSAELLRKTYKKIKKQLEDGRRNSLRKQNIPVEVEEEEDDPFIKILDPGSADIDLGIGHIKRKRQQKLTLLLLTRGSQLVRERTIEQLSDEEKPKATARTQVQKGVSSGEMRDCEIVEMFEALEIELEQLDSSLPPGYSPNNGWFGKTGSVLDLLYKALMIKRARDKEDKQRLKGETSPRESSPTRGNKSVSSPQKRAPGQSGNMTAETMLESQEQSFLLSEGHNSQVNKNDLSTSSLIDQFGGPPQQVRENAQEKSQQIKIQEEAPASPRKTKPKGHGHAHGGEKRRASHHHH